MGRLGERPSQEGHRRPNPGAGAPVFLLPSNLRLLIPVLFFAHLSERLLELVLFIMHWSHLAASCLLVSSAFAKRPLDHVRKSGKNADKRANIPLPHHGPERPPGWGWHHGKHNSTIIPETKNTTKFAVDGKAIPDVDFDVGESYAGLLPISDEPDASELYFWFFPSAHELAGDEIMIWLNGGPGCSSLEG
nr:putative serine carboxypeptidase [Quercus suber]